MDPASGLLALFGFLELLSSDGKKKGAPSTTQPPGRGRPHPPRPTSHAPTTSPSTPTPPAPHTAPAPTAPFQQTSVEPSPMPVPGYTPPPTPAVPAPEAAPPTPTAPATPWPSPAPASLPSFPGTGWVASQTTPDVVERAQYWNKQLWDFRSKTIRKPFVQELFGGRWITFKAAWHPGDKGAHTFMSTEAYVLRGSPTAQQPAHRAAVPTAATQPAGGVVEVTAPQVALTTGSHYLAKLQLMGMEATLATPDIVQAKLHEAGFDDVHVYTTAPGQFPDRQPFATGTTYWASGTFVHPSVTKALPSQVKRMWQVQVPASASPYQPAVVITHHDAQPPPEHVAPVATPATAAHALPPFPGSAWVAAHTTPDVVARAEHWNPQLWDFATKTIRQPFVQEQLNGQWMTFKAAWHPGASGPHTYMATEAYVLHAAPAGDVAGLGTIIPSTYGVTPSAVTDFKNRLATDFQTVAQQIRPTLDEYHAQFWDGFWARWTAFLSEAVTWLNAHEQMEAAHHFEAELAQWRGGNVQGFGRPAPPRPAPPRVGPRAPGRMRRRVRPRYWQRQQQQQQQQYQQPDGGDDGGGAPQPSTTTAPTDDTSAQPPPADASDTSAQPPPTTDAAPDDTSGQQLDDGGDATMDGYFDVEDVDEHGVAGFRGGYEHGGYEHVEHVEPFEHPGMHPGWEGEHPWGGEALTAFEQAQAEGYDPHPFYDVHDVGPEGYHPGVPMGPYGPMHPAPPRFVQPAPPAMAPAPPVVTHPAAPIVGGAYGQMRRYGLHF